MLGSSALVLAIFGIGISFALFEDENDNDSTTECGSEDDETSLMGDPALSTTPEESDIIPIEAIIEFEVNLQIDADHESADIDRVEDPTRVSEVDRDTERADLDMTDETQRSSEDLEIDASSNLSQGTETPLPYDLMTQTNFDLPTNDAVLPSPDSEESVNLGEIVSGGPGCVLIGSFKTDSFIVSLGGPDATPTKVSDFSVASRDSDVGQNSLAGIPEVIWFESSEGDLLSREELLSKDMRFEENQSSGDVTIHFNEHQSVVIQGVTLSDLTQNSLTIGNFSIN